MVIGFLPVTFFNIFDSDECIVKIFYCVMLPFLNIPYFIIASGISFMINVWSLFYWPLQEKILDLYFDIF